MSLLRICRLLVLAFIMFSSGKTLAQESFNYNFNNTPLAKVLDTIEKDHRVQIFYIPEWLNNIEVTGVYSAKSINELLNKILENIGISVVQYDNTSFVLINNIQDGQIVETYTKEGEKLRKFIIGSDNQHQKNAIITGQITDLESKEPVTGATIRLKDTQIGSVANSDGYYKLNLPVGEHVLVINSVGYHEEELHVVLRSDGELNITLVSSTNTLDEITIIGQSEKEMVSEAQMSVDVIEMKDVEYVPSLMGEKDIVKAIALLPGVVSGEGTNGYSVRGSSLGQNLIFVDGAPVYNSSHLFGLFSIFNPGVVSSSTIYKGTMPAQYGGRVASVMNVNIKDGLDDKITGEAGIGLISSRLHLEGPVSKKIGIVVGGRTSYVNRYLERVENADIRKSSAGFYDINAKVSFKANNNNTFSINTLISNDAFTLPNQDYVNYGTQLFSAKWGHVISETAVNNITLAYSNYSSTNNTKKSLINESIENGISSVLFKSNLSLFHIDKHAFNAGLEGNFTTIDPGKSTEDQQQQVYSTQIEKEKGLEFSLFASDEFSPTNRITLNYGLRYSTFSLLGPGTEYSYLSNEPKQTSTISDSTTYSKNEVVQFYHGLEPRFFFKYQVNNNLDLKFNVGRAYQYIHLVSNTASISPLSIFKLSDSNIKPQVADQAAIGIFKRLDKKPIEFGAEVFYRRINNLPDYKNGADLTNNPNLEREIIFGIGKAYGIELQAAKNSGKLSGLLSYSYTRSLSKMTSSLPDEQINAGEYYSSDYDIPHTISLTGDYMLTRAWSLSFNWVYNSGRPISYPEAIYYDHGIPVLYFNKRNTYRIPDYHRLDLSLNWKTPNLKLNKKWDVSWSFSMYNVYGRSNAYSIFFQRVGNITQAKKLSILAQPIPSATLIIKFL